MKCPLMKDTPILKYDPPTKFSYWIILLFCLLNILFKYYEIQENETILYGSDFAGSFGK